MVRRIDGEWWAAAVALAVAGVGWGIHATLLALLGTLGAITAVVLWVWARECLTGVTYTRTLAQPRAVFGEEVTLDIEMVNDKLLPLTWLHVAEEVPPALTIRGGTVLPGQSGLYSELHQLLPMLPYQRVRRRFTVVCNHRGEHTFGPTLLRSGNPVGYREKIARIRDPSLLLVYPKVFRLVFPTVASRMPLGDHRGRPELLGDPSRPAGVREYRAGDPLRHVDWRATARSTSLLVRVHEPSSALRVAVFADFQASPSRRHESNHEVSEFTIAITASVVADLLDRGVATGLYSSGTVRGRPIARNPTTSPTALPAMLELLARCSTRTRTSIAELLIDEARRLRGASAVVIASDYPDSTLIGLSEIRRLLPVTAIWVVSGQGRRPPPQLVDACWEVSYSDDWKERDVVELAK
jgi:uncharacterized protein (DUF58 family)